VTWDMEPGTFYGIYRGTSAYLSDAVLLNEEWINQENFEDTKVDTGVIYYYWIRASDNPQGSNTTGYSSGFSNYDTGWATDSNMYVGNNFPSSNIQVMPNPCYDSFRINFAENTSGFFQLYDQMGNLIMLRTVYSGEVLRIDGLSPGMYIMKLIIKDISYYKKIAVSY